MSKLSDELINTVERDFLAVKTGLIIEFGTVQESSKIQDYFRQPPAPLGAVTND